MLSLKQLIYGTSDLKVARSYLYEYLFIAPPFITTTIIELAFTICAIFNTLFYNVFMRKLTVMFCFSSVPPKMAALSHSHVFAYLFCLAGVSAVSNTVSHPLQYTVTL